MIGHAEAPICPSPRDEPWMTGALVYPDAFWRFDPVGLRP